MPKQIKRTVDDHLPKWLHSRFLSAINYIWEVRGQAKEETLKRVDQVWESGQFTDEEMSWIMLMSMKNKTQTRKDKILARLKYEEQAQN